MLLFIEIKRRCCSTHKLCSSVQCVKWRVKCIMVLEAIIPLNNGTVWWLIPNFTAWSVRIFKNNNTWYNAMPSYVHLVEPLTRHWPFLQQHGLDHKSLGDSVKMKISTRLIIGSSWPLLFVAEWETSCGRVSPWGCSLDQDEWSFVQKIHLKAVSQLVFCQLLLAIT